MADKKDAKGGGKKPEAKDGGASPFAMEAQFLLILAVLAMILFIIVPTVMIFFGYSGKLDIIPDHALTRLYNLFSSFVDTVGFISIFLSLMLWMSAKYLKVRIEEIVEGYEKVIEQLNTINKRQIQGDVFTTIAPTAPISPTGSSVVPGNLPGATVAAMGENFPSNNAPRNPKWLEIEQNMQSPRSADWKVAILEADILLFDMLRQMGYEGDSIGEILKKVDRANFVTVDDAWKAHRIRNIIAHEGTSYELERSEAERTIRLFKRVFDEFYFI